MKQFRAVLEPLKGNLGWVVARLPFDPQTSWKKMVRLRVKVEIGGQVFRTSLFPESGGKGYFLLVNKKMQKAAGVKVGSMIDLAIEPDLEERQSEAPPELAKIFKTEKALARWFAKLSESMRRDVNRLLDEVKSADAKQRRAEQLAERMLLTMEAEKVLPPILEIAFRRSPAAAKGWAQMTETQRRGHLMGVFYYQSPEAREKRVGKVLDECRRIAAAKEK